MFLRAGTGPCFQALACLAGLAVWSWSRAGRREFHCSTAVLIQRGCFERRRAPMSDVSVEAGRCRTHSGSAETPHIYGVRNRTQYKNQQQKSAYFSENVIKTETKTSLTAKQKLHLHTKGFWRFLRHFKASKTCRSLLLPENMQTCIENVYGFEADLEENCGKI